jgi:hypothetical protein
MKKLIMLAILAILPHLCFSQVGYPRIIVLESDTVVVISRAQVKNLNLLHVNYDFASIQLDSLERVATDCQELILINKDLQRSIITKDSLVSNKDSVYTEIITVKDKNINKLERKIKKRTVIGSVIGGLLLILIVIFAVS